MNNKQETTLEYLTSLREVIEATKKAEQESCEFPWGGYFDRAFASPLWDARNNRPNHPRSW